MIKKEKVKALLHLIQAEVGCNYLSDLYLITFNEHVKDFIRSIPPSQYSLKEWNEAVSYLLQTSCYFESVEEAKHELLEKK